MSRLTDLVERAVGVARSIIEGGQEATPVVIVGLPNGTEEVLLTPYESEAHKVAILAAVRAFLRLERADLYVQLSEAWVSAQAEVSPSEDPARREILMVVGRTRAGEVVSFTMPIHVEAGRRCLGERESIDLAVGRMVNLFE